MLYLHVIEVVREDVYRRPLAGGWSAAEARLRSEFGEAVAGLDEVLRMMQSSSISLTRMQAALNSAAERRNKDDTIKAGTDRVTKRRREGEAAPKRAPMSQAERAGWQRRYEQGRESNAALPLPSGWRPSVRHDNGVVSGGVPDPTDAGRADHRKLLGFLDKMWQAADGDAHSLSLSLCS